MAKVQIKSEKVTPFGGLFFVSREFRRYVMPYVDKYLGLRSKLIGYQYSEILNTMASNFFCGGDRMEDINVLKEKMPQHPEFTLCSPDTVLRAISELATDDICYTSPEGATYRFNTAERLNGLMMYIAVKSGMLVPGRKYDFDFDHEYIESETWEAVPTYKGFRGYGPGCAVLTDVKNGTNVIAGIENRDGNTPVKFHQEDTLERILLNIIEQGMKIHCARVDCGSYTSNVVKLLLEHSDFIFVRAAMNKTLREKLKNPRRQWRPTEVGGIQTEVLTLPFDGLGGDIPHCRLVVQRQRKKHGT